MMGRKGTIIIGIYISLLLIFSYYRPDVNTPAPDSNISAPYAKADVGIETPPGEEHSVGDPDLPTRSRGPKLVILIHDVSPVYSEYLKEVVRIISTYGLQSDTYLLIIPNHAEEYDLREYPEFVEYLHSLQREGYHIGLHGYTHIGREFECNKSAARKMLEKALEIMHGVNLTPEVFLPPRYALSSDARDVILAQNLTIITKDSVILPGGAENGITNREYTWYISKLKLPFELRRAKKDYETSEGSFFLSIHLKAVNNEAGMEFLRRFLDFVKKGGIG